MLSKESKIRVLENFYALDYVLFGKPISEMDTCCPALVEDYLLVKGALMSVFIEMVKLVKHSPKKLIEKVDDEKLKEGARRIARICRESAKRLVVSEKSKQNIKKELSRRIQENQKIDVPKTVDYIIKEKSYKLAVDNLLVARTLTESKKFDKLNEWEGRIIEDSYKILRDNLVEGAMLLLDELE
jgi:hypothetical protein